MTAPDHLPHAIDDCTGEWNLSGQLDEADRRWICTICGKEYPSDEETDRAATLEYLAGVQLRNQTRRGRMRGLPPPRFPGISMEIPDPEEDEPENWR